MIELVVGRERWRDDPPPNSPRLWLLLTQLYHMFLEQTKLSPAIKVRAAGVLLIGALAQSGGFFLHMAIGQPRQPSLGTTVTTGGAALLVIAIMIPVYGLITSR
jgi:hypothetical protein